MVNGFPPKYNNRFLKYIYHRKDLIKFIEKNFKVKFKWYQKIFIYLEVLWLKKRRSDLKKERRIK